MPDTDLPNRRTATREGYQASASIQVRVEQFDVVMDLTDFVLTMPAKQAQQLAKNLLAAAAVAERARKDHEPPAKDGWVPGAMP